jgi:hypothetical protein
MGEEQVKLGWCAGLNDAGLIKQAGYDYIELPLAAQDFSAGAKIDSPLPVGAFNYFFPQDMRIVGDDVDEESSTATSAVPPRSWDASVREPPSWAVPGHATCPTALTVSVPRTRSSTHSTASRITSRARA